LTLEKWLEKEWSKCQPRGVGMRVNYNRMHMDPSGDYVVNPTFPGGGGPMIGNNEYKRELAKSGKLKCGYCKPHRGENVGRKPKPDKYKSRRKGRG